MVIGTFLGVLMLLGTASCSDDHFDVIPESATGAQNLWENILGNGEFALVEMLVNRFVIKRKYPDHDAANLVVPSGDIFVFAGEDRDDVTLLRISTNVVDGS